MSNSRDRTLHLNLFGIGYGAASTAWFHPSVDPGQPWDLAHHIRTARLAERGLFDSLFVPDGQGMSLTDPTSGGNGATAPEPLTLLSALISSTERIGLSATFSTTFNEPYNVARYLASLDVLSGGRAGWNIVTSQKTADAKNFGLDILPDHAQRYRRGAEFVEVVKGLWGTWDADAIVGDKARGVLVDPTKVRTLDHDGEFFRVRGPLNVPRSPQGAPLLFQAGQSEHGQSFAAAYADAIFTAETNLDDARAFYRRIKERVSAVGRDPEAFAVVPGLHPFVTSTEREAKEQIDFLQSKIELSVLNALWKGFTGLDFAGVDLDLPVPARVWEDAGDTFRSRVDVLQAYAEENRLTARELLAHSALSKGHGVVAGPPEKVADYIERWFRADAADGFNIQPGISSLTLEGFVDHVVPLLQKRGIYRREYSGTTLRGHYGAPYTG